MRLARTSACGQERFLMPKLLDERPLVRINARVYAEDWDALGELTTSDMKRNELLRRILHTYVVQAKDQMRRAIDAIEREPASID